mmetsp:Transcript_15839/g.29275  ORF Transcript_15839/g.29275 Transcript_15839/m.29275 type:complete len:325 (-) Transcript_15839:21-995(-)
MPENGRRKKKLLFFFSKNKIPFWGGARSVLFCFLFLWQHNCVLFQEGLEHSLVFGKRWEVEPALFVGSGHADGRAPLSPFFGFQACERLDDELGAEPEELLQLPPFLEQPPRLAEELERHAARRHELRQDEQQPAFRFWRVHHVVLQGFQKLGDPRFHPRGTDGRGLTRAQELEAACAAHHLRLLELGEQHVQGLVHEKALVSHRCAAHLFERLRHLLGVAQAQKLLHLRLGALRVRFSIQLAHLVTARRRGGSSSRRSRRFLFFFSLGFFLLPFLLLFFLLFFLLLVRLAALLVERGEPPTRRPFRSGLLGRSGAATVVPEPP